MKIVRILVAAAVAVSLGAATATAYPLDAAEATGIARLEGYRLAGKGEVTGATLYKGSYVKSADIRLRLTGREAFDLPDADAELSRKLRDMLGADGAHYGVAMLDLTDPENPRYAEHQGNRIQNPGSVGKVLVALGLLQELADAYPDDTDARRRVLKDTQVTADAFIGSDSHTVPLWNDGDAKITKRPLRVGDTANLWTYLDWMCSNSSNAAAAMLQKEMTLLAKFGTDYPRPVDESNAWLAETPKTELRDLFAEAIQGPITRNGLDLEKLRQGSVFSSHGKARLPGTSSHATARELMRFLLKMEQGRLVDEFSSLEMKRLLYLTDRRIRYASSPALGDSAVYYKSGSLYSCQPEPDFKCYKYHGNVKNYMNSLAVVETIGRDPGLHYMVVVTSNVLRKNSAVAHQTLATRIHRLFESLHPKLGTGTISPESEK